MNNDSHLGRCTNHKFTEQSRWEGTPGDAWLDILSLQRQVWGLT